MADEASRRNSYTTAGGTQSESPGPPEAFIQWKGTHACLDFRCPCGAASHFDGYFAHALRCGACGRSFTMPVVVPLVEIDASHYDFDRAKATELI